MWNANGARYRGNRGPGDGGSEEGDLLPITWLLFSVADDGVRLLIGAAAAIGFAWQCAYIRRDALDRSATTRRAARTTPGSERSLRRLSKFGRSRRSRDGRALWPTNAD